MKGKIRKAVFIVTYKKERRKIFYLIMKRKLHWKGWEFPKGGVNDKEPIFLEIARELKEETNQFPLKIKKFNYRGKYKYDRAYRDRPGITEQTFSLYSAEIKSRKIKLSKEHFAYKWLTYDKALALLTWENQRKSLEIVNNVIKLS